MTNVLDAVENFKLFGQIPTVQSAFFSSHGPADEQPSVHLSLSSRSYTSLSRQIRRPSIALSFRESNNERFLRSARWVPAGPAQDVKDDSVKALITAHPLSASLQASAAYSSSYAVLREAASPSNSKRRTVELWKGERLLRSIDVSSAHGPFFTDGIYGSLALHDNRILYSAEAKPLEKVTEIARRPEQGSGDRDGLEAYEYRPPLGSLYKEQEYPSIFLLDFGQEDSTATSSKGAKLYQVAPSRFVADPKQALLDQAILGQAIFDASGERIILTAYPPIHDGRRLGLAACTNRPSVVLGISSSPADDELQPPLSSSEDRKEVSTTKALLWRPSTWKPLSNLGKSARNPTVVASKTCVWLESESEGAHRNCDALVSWTDSEGARHSTIEEVAVQADATSPLSWPGLFCDSVPAHCALSKVSSVVLSTIWGSRRTIVLHRLGETGFPIDVTPQNLKVSLPEECKNDEKEVGDDGNDATWSYVVHCTNGRDLIIATRSSLARPAEILLGQAFEEGPTIRWTLLKRLAHDWHETRAMKVLREKRVSIVDSSEDEKKSLDTKEQVQTIIFESKDLPRDGKTPGVLLLHGGPHGTSCTDFSPALAAICCAGFSVILPNYHGSLGRGQSFVRSLIGRCGRLDVDDCHAAAEYAINKCNVDPDQLFVDGGSHGGFLALHLVGQFPHRFRRAIVRNPVSAAHLMEGTNDIPDWFYAEFGLPFRFDSPSQCITTAQFDTLSKASPLRYIADVKAPVLLLVGLEDQRVAPSQSKIIYHALRAQSNLRRSTFEQVRMLTFADQGHPLDGVEAELISLEARIRWLASN